MIQLKNISVTFGRQNLFSNASLIIQEGEKLALIGQNGAGKTTLLRCLTGEIEYEGEIEIDGKLSFLEQESQFDVTEGSFEDYLLEKKQKIKDKISKIEDSLAHEEVVNDEELFQRKIAEHVKLTSLLEADVESKKLYYYLDELDLDHSLMKSPIRKLSGGEKTKFRLAECLAREADYYIFDEPTNHLDISTIKKLESFIKELKSCIIISHDRYFLKRVTNKVIEIENKQWNVYNENFGNFIIEKERRHDLLRKQFKENEKKRKKLLDSAKEKRRWASISRNKRFIVMAERLEREAANIPVVDRPDEFKSYFSISFPEGTRAGSEALTIKDLSFNFQERQLFKDVNLEVMKGEKWAIVGDNGSGKSTLLKLIAGILKPKSGIIQLGNNINFGYFDQQLSNLDFEKSIFENLELLSPGLYKQDLFEMAGKFGLDVKSLDKELGKLSGGERARFNLLRLTRQECNVLFLDEPTNNIDAELITSLEDALIEFSGTLIFVSHDRYFIDKLAKRLIVIEDNSLTTKMGNYSDNFGDKN